MACKCHPDPTEIRITLDGDKWCALRGPDLQVGGSGFGDSPEEALHNLLVIGRRTARAAEYESIHSTVKLPCISKECEGCPFSVRKRCLRYDIAAILSRDLTDLLAPTSTDDLVNELRSREGVKELQVAPGDIYQIKTLDGQKKDQDMISRGPGRILVVID
jgi:hypothetical protein